MFSSKAQTASNNLDDIVYLDVNLNTTVSNSTPQPLQRTIAKTIDIIGRRSDYYVGIARLLVPTNVSIPLWIPELLIGGNGYQLNMTVSLTYNGFSSGPVYLNLIRSRLDVELPPLPITAQPTTAYAFVYSMDTIMAMYNTAFATAFATLSGLTTLPTNSKPPVFVYNPSTQLITANLYPFVAYDLDAPSQAIGIWFGANCASFMDGWRILVINSNPAMSPANNYEDIKLYCGDTSGDFLDIVTPVATTNTWVPFPGDAPNPFVSRNPATAIMQVTQQSPSLCFRACQSIQVISSGLGTAMEFVDTPLASLSTGNQNVTASVLADFCPDYSSIGIFQQELVYAPGSVVPGLRYIAMSGDDPLRGFSLSVSWVDALGVSRPMYVASPSQPASIKLVFVRRKILERSIGNA